MHGHRARTCLLYVQDPRCPIGDVRLAIWMQPGGSPYLTARKNDTHKGSAALPTRCGHVEGLWEPSFMVLLSAHPSSEVSSLHSLSTLQALPVLQGGAAQPP